MLIYIFGAHEMPVAVKVIKTYQINIIARLMTQMYITGNIQGPSDQVLDSCRLRCSLIHFRSLSMALNRVPIDVAIIFQTKLTAKQNQDGKLLFTLNFKNNALFVIYNDHQENTSNRKSGSNIRI